MPDPIRIMRIIARLNIGGPAIHVTLLTEKLGPPPHERMLVCGTVEDDEGDMRYYAREHGVEPVVIDTLQRSILPFKDLRTGWQLYQLMKDFEPDVVHTHTAKAGFLGRMAARFARVPVVVHTFHGHVFSGYYGSWKTQLFLTLERLAARNSDRIITLTEGLRRELSEVYRITRKSRIVVLPLGLDLQRFAEAPRKPGGFRAQYNIPAEVPLIGVIGRLVPIKNHRLFLEAARMLCDMQPNAHFVIVGDGETRSKLEALVDEFGLTGHVHFTGWVKDVAPVYADLDLTVISSDNEGTPVSLIEALASGCPVVSTAVGGVPDLLDGGTLGTLVPKGDARALSRSMLQMLINPPDPGPAQRAMIERYSIDRLANDLESLYRSLLNSKRITAES